MDPKSPLREVLEKARQRCVAHLLLDQSALALTIGMGGAILLLLAGTQILDWYWVVLLTAVSLGVGVWRLWNTIPTRYKLAQWIDRRLELADTLSTATYFESDTSRGHEAIRNRQREEAENAARTVELKVALPFRRPRFAYPAIALGLVAFGLFALRYAVTGSLSLKPSLVQYAMDTFFPPKQQAKLDKRHYPLKPPSADDTNPNAPTVQNQDAPDQPLDAQDAPDASNPQAADNSKESAEKGAQDKQNSEVQGDQNDKGDKQGNSNDSNDENSKQNSSKDGKQQASKEGKQGSENQQQNASLMDKLKDAMSNMMNKMKSSSSKDGQQSQQQDAKNGQGQKDGKNSQNKQGKQDQAKSDAQSDQQQSEGGDQKQTADAKGAEKSSDKNASQDSKSGVGSADGDKSAKEAEQLAAMGKISEILGKRAQNVTGEVMVEVGESKQQLKTPWAQKQAQHVEAGSEIHRDEVPLMYQQFVEQYFEEIRKSSAPPKAPAKPAAPKQPNPGN